MQASSRSLVAIPALSAWRRRSRRISSDRPYQEAASGRWRLSSVALILDTCGFRIRAAPARRPVPDALGRRARQDPIMMPYERLVDEQK
eukprot:tig00000219_g19515.t1